MKRLVIYICIAIMIGIIYDVLDNVVGMIMWMNYIFGVVVGTMEFGREK